MVELDSPQFARVSSLFDENLPNRPMLESVLADRNPGWVFADSGERPTAAVVVSRYSFSYLGGHVDRALLECALTRSVPAAEPLVIWPANAAVPEGVGPRTIDRIEFSHLEPTWTAPLTLPDKILLQPMTLDLLEQCLWKD